MMVPEEKKPTICNIVHITLAILVTNFVCVVSKRCTNSESLKPAVIRKQYCRAMITL